MTKKLFISLLATLILFPFCSNATDRIGKKILVIGDGVTGSWVAAKISKYLEIEDELILVSPSENNTVKNLGSGVYSNYTTSSFIPIGIQIEKGPLVLRPYTAEQVDAARKRKKFSLETKLFVSPTIDNFTNTKLLKYVESSSENEQRSSIIMKFHRDLCLPEWEKYLIEGGKGVTKSETYILGTDKKSLENFREEVINNRINNGYEKDAALLQILNEKELLKIIPAYASIIQNQKLYGLRGLKYDWRVNDSGLKETLQNKVNSGKAKLVKIESFVDSLIYKTDKQSNIEISGVKLKGGKKIVADIVVIAAGGGSEKILKSASINLPILKSWGVAFAIPKIHEVNSDDGPTISINGSGIMRNLPRKPINLALAEWILSENETPNIENVLDFTQSVSKLWGYDLFNGEWIQNNPIHLQARPYTLDNFPVFDATFKGLVIVNPCGSLGNTQGPGSGVFAAYKVLEKLGRPIPTDLNLPDSINWKRFELYKGRFD